MSLQKRNYIRSKKITQSAKDELCTWPGCGAPAQCWAHSNLQSDGKGTRIKAEDIYGAALCQQHHDLYDSRTVAGWLKTNSQQDFDLAMKKSWKLLFEKGILKIT